MTKIRELREADLPAIAEIFNQYLGVSVMVLDPLSGDDFKAYLNERPGRYAMIVAERAGQVIGYASIKPWSDRRGYHRAGEVSIFLDKNQTGGGTGTQLYDALGPRVRALNYRYLAAKIQANNPGSIRFHERRGYRTVGVQRGIGEVEGRLVDVVIMEKLLS